VIEKDNMQNIALAPSPETFLTFQELLSQHHSGVQTIGTQRNIFPEVESNTVEIPFPMPQPTPSPLLATQIFSILSPTVTPLPEVVADIAPTFPEAPPAFPSFPAMPLLPLPPKINTTHATEPDNLLYIEGITPILEQLLHECGIITYQQIAQWSDTDTDALGILSLSIMPRFRRFAWSEQADTLHKEKYGSDG
jgi:hypothetical protein